MMAGSAFNSALVVPAILSGRAVGGQPLESVQFRPQRGQTSKPRVAQRTLGEEFLGVLRLFL